MNTTRFRRRATTPKWKRRLTKTQLKHLREAGMTTLAKAKRGIEYQQKLRKEWLESPEPVPFHGCWDCISIGKRLGLIG